ncbi:MAG: site-specific integrase, partial [Betaproteobacteria bacterium]|nr:site-specific integrase [Betaproteobacteria bacterium]
MDSRFNFTKESLVRLPLPEQGTRATYHDDKTTGLQLRVTAAGVKTFSVYRRIKGGQPERVTLGRFPELTVENARKLAARVNAAIEEGSNPAEVKRAHKEEVTLSEFFKHFIENKRNRRKGLLSPLTKIGYSRQYEIYLEPHGQKKLSQISQADVKKLIKGIGDQHPVMANRVRALISSIYGMAVEDGLVQVNPARGIKTYAEDSRDRFVQADELPRFFASVGEEPNESMRDYFLLSLLTGARRSNVLAMQWNHIKLAEGIWRIPDTKNGTPHNVTISPEAGAILKTRKESADGTFVFPGKGESGHLEEPKKGWKRIFDRDELKQLAARIEAAGGTFVVKGEEPLADALSRARKAAKKLKIDTDGCRIDDLRIHDLRRTLGSWQA